MTAVADPRGVPPSGLRTPHRRLLAALARYELDASGAAVLERLVAQPLDTERACSEARDQQMLPLLYHHLNRPRLLERLPAPLAERARRGYYASLLRNQAQLSLAERACGALLAAGVRPLLLKGAQLARCLYSHPALRPMADVDLLVARDELPRALQALHAVGICSEPGTGSLEYYLAEHFHIGLRDSAGLLLELHWELADRYTRAGLGAAELLAGARPLEPTRQELGLVPEPTRNLLYLALHVAKHAPLNEHLVARPEFPELAFDPASDNRLIWLLDIAKLAREPELDWPLLETLARRSGVIRSLQASLAAVERLLGPGALPRAATGCSRAPATSWPRSWLAARMLRRLGGGGRPGAFGRWLLRMDPHTQFRPLRLLLAPDILFPSLDSLAARRGLSRRGALLAYPGHVLVTGLRSLQSLARHLYYGVLRAGDGT